MHSGARLCVVEWGSFFSICFCFTHDLSPSIGVATLALMAERASAAESVTFYRPGIKLESGAIIPGTVSVTHNSSGFFDVTVIRADCTESIIECSREGTGAIKDVNADAAAIFGYSRESMLKKSACELMPQVRRVQDLLLDEVGHG